MSHGLDPWRSTGPTPAIDEILLSAHARGEVLVYSPPENARRMPRYELCRASTVGYNREPDGAT